MAKNKKYKLSTHQLKYIHGERYRPNNPNKYIIEDGIEYLNTAVPTSFMKLDGKPEKEPKAILDLLFNLLGFDQAFFEYFLNWIACNFALAKRPLTAVIIFGLEGTGKGILYHIMEKLYGEENCSQLNAESFKSDFKLAPCVEKKRFINCDEITLSIHRNKEPFFKGYLGNPTIKLGKTIETHGQMLFTANYFTVFKINDGDRRYSCKESGFKLEENNFLGFGSYKALEAKIDSELADFAKYLKSLNIDVALADEPIDTPEKRLIIGLSKSYLKDFHNAIVSLNIDYFSRLRNSKLFEAMDKDMRFYSRINRANVALAYNDLFGDNISTADIMKQLRALNQEGIFEEYNIMHSGSNHYIYPKGKKI